MMLMACGCGAKGPVARSSVAAEMFAPVSMRVHPIFTDVKDWTGDDQPDGIEALLEFVDQFGDPTKAAGKVIFELFAYRRYHADPRGERVVNPWVAPLQTLQQQQARWNRTSRTYSFQLEYPGISDGESYVLTASFDTGRTRFFDQIVLEGRNRVREVGPATQAATRAAPEAPAPRATGAADDAARP